MTDLMSHAELARLWNTTVSNIELDYGDSPECPAMTVYRLFGHIGQVDSHGMDIWRKLYIIPKWLMFTGALPSEV